MQQCGGWHRLGFCIYTIVAIVKCEAIKGRLLFCGCYRDLVVDSSLWDSL